MNNSIKILGAGLICVDLVRNNNSTKIMNGGSCANVVSVLAQIGYDCRVIREKYTGEFELFLSNTLTSLGVKELFYKHSKSSAPRIIEDLSDLEHRFYTTCPCCGKKILTLKLPSISDINIIKDLLEDINVFYCDRTSSGIRYLMNLISSQNGIVIYEPNSTRNLKGLIETLEMVDILKFSKERIPDSVAERIRTSCEKPRLIISTDGANGISFSFRTKSGAMSPWIKLPSIINGPVIDTSGAGDWLTAGFLSELLKGHDLLTLECLSDANEITNMLYRGMRYSQLCCAAIGAQGVFYSQEYSKELWKLSSYGDKHKKLQFSSQHIIEKGICSLCFSKLPMT